MSQKLLNKQETAELLNVSTRTVNRLAAAGKLKIIRFGNVFRVDPTEIEKFKLKNTSR